MTEHARTDGPDIEQERFRMVESQIAARGVSDVRLLDAMREVPREAFISDEMAAHAYEDGPLPIGEGQTISQPYIVAVMLEAAEIGTSDRVLEVGAGCGYAASIIGRLAEEVHAVERHAVLAELASRHARELGYENVHIHQGDGTLGWPERAPYDAIVVSAGGAKIPEPLYDQLAIGGVLVIPVEDQSGGQVLRVVRRVSEAQYEESSLGRVSFVPLIGGGE